MRQHMTIKKLSLCVGLALFANFAVAGGPNNPNAPSGPATAEAVGELALTGEQIISASGKCNKVTVNIKGVVKGTVDDGGGVDQVTFDLWDDGTLKDSSTLSIPVGSSILVDVTLKFEGLYLTGAPGVGVYANELGWTVDPFYPTDVKGTCSSNPIKCWIEPNSAQKGETVTFYAELPNGARSVKAFNGDLAISNMVDLEGDNIYTGSWKVPGTIQRGWNRQFAIQAFTANGEVWCPGVNVIREPSSAPAK